MKRSELMSSLIEKGDSKTLGALLGAGVPAFLSGLTDEQVRVYTELHNRKRAPHLAGKLDRAAANKSLEHLRQLQEIRDAKIRADRERRATQEAVRPCNGPASGTSPGRSMIPPSRTARMSSCDGTTRAPAMSR